MVARAPLTAPTRGAGACRRRHDARAAPALPAACDSTTDAKGGAKGAADVQHDVPEAREAGSDTHEASGGRLT
jgi:hypothetical protein